MKKLKVLLKLKEFQIKFEELHKQQNKLYIKHKEKINKLKKQVNKEKNELDKKLHQLQIEFDKFNESKKFKETFTDVPSFKNFFLAEIAKANLEDKIKNQGGIEKMILSDKKQLELKKLLKGQNVLDPEFIMFLKKDEPLIYKLLKQNNAFKNIEPKTTNKA